jgi:hypothetical protein
MRAVAKDARQVEVSAGSSASSADRFDAGGGGPDPPIKAREGGSAMHPAVRTLLRDLVSFPLAVGIVRRGDGSAAVS